MAKLTLPRGFLGCSGRRAGLKIIEIFSAVTTRSTTWISLVLARKLDQEKVPSLQNRPSYIPISESRRCWGEVRFSSEHSIPVAPRSIRCCVLARTYASSLLQRQERTAQSACGRSSHGNSTFIEPFERAYM